MGCHCGGDGRSGLTHMTLLLVSLGYLPIQTNCTLLLLHIKMSYRCCYRNSLDPLVVQDFFLSTAGNEEALEQSSSVKRNKDWFSGAKFGHRLITHAKVWLTMKVISER